MAINRLLTLALVAGSMAVMIWQIAKARAGGPLPQIRKIAALEAIPEVVGRAVEMGRPIHFSSGFGRIDDEHAPQTLAATEILGHISKIAAEYDAQIVTTVCQALVLPVQADAMRQGYAMAGKQEKFSEDNQVRFASEVQMAFASATAAFIQRERAAVNIMIGPFFGETMLIAESAAHAGSIQIMGTVRMFQLPFMAVVADYLLIGEEMYAAGAYITKDRVRLGGVRGQDIVKAAVLVYMAAGAVTWAFGNRFLVQLITRYGN